MQIYIKISKKKSIKKLFQKHYQESRCFEIDRNVNRNIFPENEKVTTFSEWNVFSSFRGFLLRFRTNTFWKCFLHMYICLHSINHYESKYSWHLCIQIRYVINTQPADTVMPEIRQLSQKFFKCQVLCILCRYLFDTYLFKKLTAITNC